MKKSAIAFVAVTFLVAVASARASTTVTYTNGVATNIKKEKGEILKASATFVVSNLDLVVTLSNTGAFDPRSPGDILTGLFFDLIANPALTPVSATVAPGSTVIGHRLPLGFDGDVGGEWAYKGDLVNAPGGDAYGVSSTKLSLFKKVNLFSDEIIPGTHPLSGAQFGVTTLNDLFSNDQGGIKNKGLIQSTVVFVFSGLPSDFTLNDISGVTFQYGKSIKSGIDIAGELVAQIPEPSTVTLVALGLIGALTLARSGARRQ